MAKDLNLSTNEKTKNYLEEINKTDEVIDAFITPVEEKQKEIKARIKRNKEAQQEKKRGRPRQHDTNKKSADMGLPDNLTRSSFIVNKETLKKLKDFAFNENLKIYEALDLILSSYLERYEKQNKGISEREKKTKRLKEL